MIQLLNLSPAIRIMKEKKLIGKRISISLSNNRTPELWRSFMPRRKEIVNNLNQDFISMQVFEDFSKFTPETVHEKWAAVEVPDFDHVPADMETFVLPGGLYAVFHYKGTPATFAPTFQYIFGTWFPASGYVVDNRPHFEVIGEKYKNNDPDSEEEIWIPIKQKT